MKTLQRLWFSLTVLAIVAMTLPLESWAQRSRGGSFGGSRSGGRSYSMPRRAPSGGGSFGGRRSPYSAPRRTQQSPSTASPGSSPGSFGSAPRSSQQNTFGGSRLNSASDYTSRYGTPRRTERAVIPNASSSQPYVINRYGGMGDGFMMGYLMGSIPWYYSMPFHPAFYFSRPYTSVNPDGTTAVYPGTFQWGTLLFSIIVIGGIAFIVLVWLRNRRRQLPRASDNDWNSSSFA